MNWWKRKKESSRRVKEAEAALAGMRNDKQEAKELRADATQRARSFEQRAISLREIRRQNHITPSIFPPQERTYP